MDMLGDDPNFLSEILLTGEVDGVAGLDELEFGLTEETEIHGEGQSTRSTKQGSKRTKNFHYKEDEIICSGWLNVSKDPIHGANQTRSSFWARVKAFFDKYKETTEERSLSSIMHRWLTIQLQVNKFCSCYEAILRRNQSGLSIDDKVVEAKKLYVELYKGKKTFGLDHCWKILKGEDKWKARMIQLAELEKEKQSKKKQKTSTKQSRPRDEEENGNDEDKDADVEETAPKKRPEGIKKAKEKLKGAGSEACMEALQMMIAKREVLEKAKEERFMASIQLEKEALEVGKKKAEAKLLKEEKEIMLADMSSLSPVQRQWIEKMQKKIMEKDLA